MLLGVIVLGASRLLGGGGGSTTIQPSDGPSGSTGSSSGGVVTENPGGGSAGTLTTIEYWSLWEPCEVFETAFEEFELQYPDIRVECEQQVFTDYRERLQTAIASRSGPDVFRFHASWTPMLSQELASIPSSIFSASEYRQTFYPIAEEQLQVDGQLVGVPLMYDGLLLYYNEALLETANLSPPQTWSEVREAARTLTLRSGSEVTRGGLAIGNSTNVEHFSDIIGLLILQNGGDPTDPSSQEVLDAVTFYTNFITKDQVWSDALPSSTVAFAREEAAMMIAPSWRAHEVQALNPSLEFSVMGAPQLSTADTLTWATYWAEGVSAQSEQKDEAWELLKFLSSREIQQELYSQQATIRGFGEPYSRQDLADQVTDNDVVSVLLSEAGSASNWYLNSFTHDNGLNDQLVKYYEDAVTAIVDGRGVTDAMDTVSLGTQQTLRQYGLE